LNLAETAITDTGPIALSGLTLLLRLVLRERISLINDPESRAA
jgi:hypothetical protein